MRRYSSILLILPLLLATALTVSALAIGGADLTVHLPNGRVVTRHIPLETSITGLALLQRAGLNVEVAGGAVCRIEGVGCPASDCFCDFKPGGTHRFWAYWRWSEHGWVSSEAGAGQATVNPGDLDGWRWSDGPPTTDDGSAPSLIGPQRAAYAGADWLRTQQLADGAFVTVTNTSLDLVGLTLDAVLAAHAADADIGAWHRGTGQTALNALATWADRYATLSVGAQGKLVAAIVAAEGNPYQFAGRDRVADLRAALQGGRFGESNWDQAWAILGLRAVGESAPAEAVQTLLADGGATGGWGFAPSRIGEVDSTGLVLQALAAAGAPITHTAIVSATAFLHAQQNDDGGFPVRRPATGPSISNGPSTGLAVSGLLAIGENPLAVAWQKGGRSAIDYLLTLQSPEGSFVVNGPNAIQATGQIVPALMGKFYPPRGKRVAAYRAAAWLRGQQAADGHFGFGEGNTVDALFVIGALGDTPDTWRIPGGASLLEYLAPRAQTYAANSVAANAKLILGLLAVGVDPRGFGGVDLVSVLTGRLGGTLSNSDLAWASLALRGLDQSSAAMTSATLRSRQGANGGWGFDTGARADTNTTALALQALVAASEPLTSTAIVSATAYLRDLQFPVGGFPYPFDEQMSPDENSTAIVLQALTALNADPDGLGWTTRLEATSGITLTARTPVDWLLTQQSDSGAFAFGGVDDVYSTLQVIPALLDRAQPIVTRRLYLPLIDRGVRLRGSISSR